MREPSASARVLAFQFHAGNSGQCALDGFGLTPHSWQNSRVATTNEVALARFIRRAVRRFHPAVVVLGISRRKGALDLACRRHACAVLRALGIPTVVRHVREAYQLFRDRVRGTRREELAYVATKSFLPDVFHGFKPAQVRDRRSAWHALVLALVELIHRFPRAAAALATSWGLSLPKVRDAIQEAELRLHPV